MLTPSCTILRTIGAAVQCSQGEEKLNVKTTTKDNIKLVTPEHQLSVAAEDYRAITKDDVAQRAYKLFLARGRVDGHDVGDWLEAERQLQAEQHGLSMLK